MHLPRDSLLVSNSLKKACELCSLSVGKSRKHCLLVFAGDLPDHSERCAPFFGEVQRITAAITWIFPAFDKPSVLEFIQQRDQAARHHSEHNSERLLRHRRSRSKNPQNTCVMWRQLQFCQPLCEL